MKRTELLQEIRKMRFEEACEGWECGRLTQAEAASLLGVCERTFQRYLNRYREEGLDGLIDRRLEQVSHRQAPVDEVLRVVERYRARHSGWSAKHFYSWYRKEGGGRSYTWVKSRLQEAGLIRKSPGRGKHRKRRERAPWPGLMIHQDGSRHEWVPGQRWDLIVTMDDATNEHYSMFFVEEEGTASSFRGVREVIASRGLFASFYSDRGSHYWHTPEAGYKMDIASPSGGKIPLDPESLLITEMGDAIGLKGSLSRRYEDKVFMSLLDNTLKVSEVDPAGYDALYMTGGHGVMFDFPKSVPLAKLTARFYESGKIISAACHGSCGLLGVKLCGGTYLVSGKDVTGFSWKEEKLANRDEAVPFNLEEELQKRGGRYSKAMMPLGSHVVEDGLLITAQNPKSTKTWGRP